MSFWKPVKPSHEETARFKALYEQLGSLQAVADAENVKTGWLGRILKEHDRRVLGSDTDYEGPERRILKERDRRTPGSGLDYDGEDRREG